MQFAFPESCQNAEVEDIGEPAFAQGRPGKIAAFRDAHDEQALVRVVLLRKPLVTQQFDVFEVGEPLEILDRFAFALHQHPVAGSQRNVGKVRHAVAALPQQADDGNIESAAESGVA